MREVLLPHERNVCTQVGPVGERWVEGAERGHGEVWERIDEENLEGRMPEETTRRHVG
jgi:hypothetical protein